MHSETEASDIDKIKFAGFSMGMSKEEIIEALSDDSKYLVYGVNSNRYVKLFYAPNKDTVYWSKNDKCLCSSEILIDKSSWDSTWNYGGGITKIVFSEWILENPLLIFENDYLIKLSTMVSIISEDYINLYNTLRTKYGTPIKKKYGGASHLEWSIKNDIIRLLDYTHLIKNKSVSIQLPVSIEFYRDGSRLECERKKEEYKIAHFKELVSINKGGFKVCGLSNGMKRNEVETELKKRYVKKFVDIYEHEDVNIQGKRFSSNEVKISAFNDEYMLLNLKYVDEKLCYVELRPESPISKTSYLFKEIIAFYSKQLKEDDVIVYKGQRDQLHDSILFVNQNTELHIQHDPRIGSSTAILLKSINAINEIKELLQAPLKLEIKDIANQIKESCLGGFKLFTEFKVNEEPEAYNDLDDIDPNVYPSCFTISTRIDDSHKQCMSRIEKTTFRSSNQASLVVCDSHITSISLYQYFQDDYLNNYSLLIDQMINLNSIFIDELTHIYGHANFCNLKDRKSVFWHLDGVLLEVVNTMAYDRVAISIRKYNPNDLILKKSKSRSLLD